MYKKLLLIFCMTASSYWSFASESELYQSSGKFYGAYFVALILILALILYLFAIDRKLDKIEDQINDE